MLFGDKDKTCTYFGRWQRPRSSWDYAVALCRNGRHLCRKAREHVQIMPWHIVSTCNAFVDKVAKSHQITQLTHAITRVKYVKDDVNISELAIERQVGLPTPWYHFFCLRLSVRHEPRSAKNLRVKWMICTWAACALRAIICHLLH